MCDILFQVVATIRTDCKRKKKRQNAHAQLVRCVAMVRLNNRYKSERHSTRLSSASFVHDVSLPSHLSKLLPIYVGDPEIRRSGGVWWSPYAVMLTFSGIVDVLDRVQFSAELDAFEVSRFSK